MRVPRTLRFSGLIDPIVPIAVSQLQAATTMRVRIVKPTVGVLDGVSLGHLILGMTYEIEDSLGAYLVSTRSAEQVPDAYSNGIANGDDSLIEHATGGVTITNKSQRLERAVAYDRPSKRRHKRR
ncbi:MAG TPA: hypothetical protein VFO58_11335 [Vicinamibacterales bacterium]|nr:hypothetical protein [Vicinamibacterales bacterium]